LLALGVRHVCICAPAVRGRATRRARPRAQEASTLVAALGAAAGACGAPWPALVPVHDPLRDAYWGVAAAGPATVLLESESVHVSQLSGRLQRVRARPPEPTPQLHMPTHF